MGNDGSDTIPSIHLDEDDIDSIPSPLFYEHHGQDESYEEEDAHSIPSLSATFDEDDNRSSSLLSLGLSDDLSTSPKPSSKGVTDSVLAWGALAACLGAPAPKASIHPKQKRVPRDLWGEDDANGCKSAYLTLLLLDDNESSELPDLILVKDEHFGGIKRCSDDIQDMIDMWDGTSIPVKGRRMHCASFSH